MRPVEVSRCPDRMGRSAISAIDEILGSEERGRLLNLPEGRPFSFLGLASFQEAIFEAYGPRAGCGLLQRIGRAFFRHLLRELGAELGLERAEFRLLPSRKRLQAGLEAFAGALTQPGGERIDLQVGEERLVWTIRGCSLCGCPERGCPWMVGFVQEALAWLSGGKFYPVAEGKCIASRGGACTIVVDPTPIG